METTRWKPAETSGCGGRQRTSAAAYRAEFSILAAKVGWNDDALASQFDRGLKDQVRTKITMHHERLSTLKDMADLAIQIDSRVSEVQLKRKVDTSMGGRTLRSKGMFRPGGITTMVCRRCRLTPRQASQVPTKVRKGQKRDNRIKGRQISPVLNATAVERKATTKVNATPGSSVINCRSLGQVTIASVISLPPEVTETPRSRARPESSSCEQRETADMTRLEPLSPRTSRTATQR